ncbi:peptidase M15 [Saccharobesus litoralis]|uniref:Peptidase M15 n=1 Tax=Saccharobesus litoralis TaxID=2172099 RepID=A0A2S0VTW6_9ALTE|nr:M15 family metallopeptidase [Saccharobesus litoralis]AWB67657.1 peptidase M15 [Saccharobesus litoralis]
MDNLILTGQSTHHLCELYPNHMIHQDAVAGVKHLQQQAKDQGFDLRLASSYRGFQRQCQIWNEKYSGQRLVVDNKNNPIDLSVLTELERIKAICLYTAIPGTSRHHWGTDIDVYDANKIGRADLQLIETEYIDDGPCQPLANWLQVHAQALGFFLPYTAQNQLKVANEPWHLSYNPVAEYFSQSICPDLWLHQVPSGSMLGYACIKNNIESLFSDFVLFQQ